MNFHQVSKKIPKYPLMLALLFLVSFAVIFYVMALGSISQENKSEKTDHKEDISLEGNLAIAKKIKAVSMASDNTQAGYKPKKQEASLLLEHSLAKEQKGRGVKALDEEDFYRGYIQYQDRNNLLDRAETERTVKHLDYDMESDMSQSSDKKQALSRKRSSKNSDSAETSKEQTALSKAREARFLQALKAPSKVNLSSLALDSSPKNNTSVRSNDTVYPKGVFQDSKNADELPFKTLDSYEVLDQKNYISDSEVVYPKTPYALMQGSVIQAVLLTGINSELPGQITAQVTRDIRDSISATHLLIPRGSKLIGQYGTQASFGASRVFAGFNRVIFPDGSSITLGAMPGQSTDGYAGFDAKVDNHYMKTIFNCVLLSAITSSAQVMESKYDYDDGANVTVTRSARELSSNISEALSNIIERNINLSPTLSIEPGYVFSVALTKDLFFKSPYGIAKNEYFID
ncbi:MAG: TrbI/VirB10 family protein [Succinivibrio sp.]